MANPNLKIQTQVQAWFETLQELSEYDQKLKPDEQTIIEWLKNYWRNYKDLGADEGLCQSYLMDLKNYYNKHSKEPKVPSLYKTLAGIADKMFLRDNDTFHEFQKMANEYIKQHKPAAKPQSNPASVDLNVIFEASRNIFIQGGDMRTAYEGFKMCADGGLLEAYFFLAQMEENGNVGTPNPTKAFQFYKTGAEKGHVTCQAYLGLCYHQGNGTTVNEALAEQWYERAILGGAVIAEFFMAELLLSQEKNPERMFRLFKSVAESGAAISGMAHLRMGYCFEWGIGVAEDMDRAHEIYLQEKRNGNNGADEYLSSWNEHRKLMSQTQPPKPTTTTTFKPTTAKPTTTPKPTTSTTTTQKGDDGGSWGCGCLVIIIAAVLYFGGWNWIKGWFSSDDDTKTKQVSMFVLVESLNMRAAPSANGSVLATLGYGDHLNMDENSTEDWASVRTNSSNGFVARPFIGTRDEIDALLSVFSTDGTRQAVTDIRHRRALIQFVKESKAVSNYDTDGGYTLHASGSNSGNVWRHKSLGGNGVFAFILDKGNGGRVAAVCSYGQNDEPYFNVVNNNVEPGQYIEKVTYRNNEFKIVFGNKKGKKKQKTGKVEKATEVVPTAPSIEELKSQKNEGQSTGNASPGFHFERVE